MPKKQPGYETEPELRRAVAARLLALRIHKHLKPMDVKRFTAIPTKTLRSYEEGVFPSPLRLLKLAALYGSSTDFILTGQGRGAINVVLFDRTDQDALRDAIREPEPFSEPVKTEDYRAPNGEPTRVIAEMPVVDPPVTKPEPTVRKAKSKKSGRVGTMKYNFEL